MDNYQLLIKNYYEKNDIISTPTLLVFFSFFAKDDETDA